VIIGACESSLGARKSSFIVALLGLLILVMAVLSKKKSMIIT
jgi:hypothetical protein